MKICFSTSFSPIFLPKRNISPEEEFCFYSNIYGADCVENLCKCNFFLHTYTHKQVYEQARKLETFLFPSWSTFIVILQGFFLSCLQAINLYVIKWPGAASLFKEFQQEDLFFSIVFPRRRKKYYAVTQFQVHNFILKENAPGAILKAIFRLLSLVLLTPSFLLVF